MWVLGTKLRSPDLVERVFTLYATSPLLALYRELQQPAQLLALGLELELLVSSPLPLPMHWG